MKHNDLHNNCEECTHRDIKNTCSDNICGQNGFDKCNAEKINPPSGRDRFGTHGTCVYGCHWCLKYKSNKEPISRYDWAYS